MTQLILTSATGLPVLARDDRRNGDEYWHGNETYPGVIYNVHWEDEQDAGYRTLWWPYRGNLLGGLDGVSENCILSVSPKWYEMWAVSGANGRLAFVGYTRDAYGSPLAGCTVRCFRTATNELVSSVLSGANGFYQATTPYLEAHYLVVHKTGSPDVAGASVATLTPA